MLRLHFLHHRKILPLLCRCAWDSLTMFLHEALDRRDDFPGDILVPLTSGGMVCEPNADYVLWQDDVPEAGLVELLLYDISGRMIAGSSQNYLIGTHQVNFYGLSEGVYFFVMRAGDHSETERVVVLK
ncbi:MAG: T9SS type A sorting domain-containing protein [Candidatus Fermentibacteria bacterium]|nr:T9SS type A sorting domain-containing protein [Candidatus Fermentibacteria bacterium]